MNIKAIAKLPLKAYRAAKNKKDIFNNRLAELSEWHYDHVMDPAFDRERYRKDYSSYWEKLLGGVFRISRIEQEYFAAVNGIRSEAYVPLGVYYFLVNPYLNRWPFRRAYEDKSMFRTLLRIEELPEDAEVRLPQTIVSRMNGKWYAQGKRFCSEAEAAELLADWEGDLIVKPSNDTWGNGVARLRKADISKETLESLKGRYDLNFTIQECIRQHPSMASFHESSVNTVRVMTYYNSRGEYEVLRTIQRFGGGESVVDNASAGGGFCLVSPDGMVSRKVFRHRSLHTGTLPSGAAREIPSYDKILRAALILHRRLPYFDLVGWDIAVDEAGIPVVLEYNCVAPDLGLPQISGGPLFSEKELYVLMPRVFAFRNEVRPFTNRLSWDDKPNYVWSDDYGFYV